MYNSSPDKGPLGSTLLFEVYVSLELRIALFILFKDVICFSFPLRVERFLHPASTADLFINQQQSPPGQ